MNSKLVVILLLVIVGTFLERSKAKPMGSGEDEQGLNKRSEIGTDAGITEDIKIPTVPGNEEAAEVGDDSDDDGILVDGDIKMTDEQYEKMFGKAALEEEKELEEEEKAGYV